MELSDKWGLISEYGKKESTEGNSEIYWYPYDENKPNYKDYAEKYRITWPHDWPSYDIVEDDKGNIFEINGNFKVPYLEKLDKNDRLETMGV